MAFPQVHQPLSSKSSTRMLCKLTSSLTPRLARTTRCSAISAPPRPNLSPSQQPSTSYGSSSVLTGRAAQQQRQQQQQHAATPLAYELLQGNLVRFSPDALSKGAPTAVLVHGILGSRRNLHSFAHKIIQGFPSWQVLLVDLRCHGESAAVNGAAVGPGPHTVHAAARDVLALLRQLKLFPQVLAGHSFGGKTVLSMVQQFGQTLPRPVQVWVLDTLPGEVRAGGIGRKDHPSDLIDALRALGPAVASRNDVLDHLTHRGFSTPVARWMTTNLRPAGGAPPHTHARGGMLTWGFDLEGVAEMFRSYESTSLWGALEQPPQGVRVDFVRAEGSSFRWGGAEEDLIRRLGHHVHLLPNSGHWVHSDNPDGLFDIMAPSFRTGVDMSMRRAVPGLRH